VRCSEEKVKELTQWEDCVFDVFDNWSDARRFELLGLAAKRNLDADKDRDKDKDTDEVEAASAESGKTRPGQDDTVTTEPARSTGTGSDEEETSRQEGSPAKDSNDAKRVQFADPDHLPCSEAIVDLVVGVED
jgi:hypothetical protein